MYDFGENIFMNNEKYLDELDGRLQVLNELRKRIIELSKAIIGDTLYKEDFFFTSAMDRTEYVQSSLRQAADAQGKPWALFLCLGIVGCLEK